MRPSHKGFTLVELLVVIAIIGTLVALLLPAVQSARETARGNTCRNNLKQLTTAIMNMDTTQRRLPGYSNELADMTGGTSNGEYLIGRRASWVVMLFPYMEEQALWDEWSSDFVASGGGHENPAAPQMETLVCPSNVPEIPGQPWLGYVGNAGWAFSDNSRQDTGVFDLLNIKSGTPTDREYAGNGVFFDDNRNTNFGPADGRENTAEYPPIRMSLGYIQANDGQSNTLLLSENLHTWYWCFGLEPDDEDGDGNSNEQDDASNIEDAKHLFGFVWSNTPTGVERINGDKYYDRMAAPADMEEYSLLAYEPYGYPSSNHPNGVNMAFADGHVVFLSQMMDPTVYAMLMTSNAKKSKFYTLVNGEETQDRKAPQPTDDQIL